VSAGWVYRRYSTDYVAAETRKAKRRMWRGHLREILGVAGIVTAVANAGIHALGSGWDATAAGSIVIVQTFAQGWAGTSGLRQVRKRREVVLGAGFGLCALFVAPGLEHPDRM
jgi:hypothetical protein